MKTADTFRPTWTGSANIPPVIPNDCFAVTTYCVERCFGGNEEGGWWYNWYTPVRVVLCPNEDDAEKQMEEQRAADEAATEQAKQDEAAYNAACLRQAERIGADPDSIGSLDGAERFVTYVEGRTEYLGLVKADRPHYE